MIDLSKDIFDYFTSLYGSEAARTYKQFISAEHNTYLRIKKNYPSDKLLKELTGYGIQIQPENSIEGAYRIVQGENLAGKTVQHVLGKFYIQSLSSMIPPLILNPDKRDLVLDLCAAPGSKTTQISELMNNEGTLISNEISVDRIKMLIHNIDRMNLINIGVLNQKGELLSKVYANHFDKILVDAPCSALGVLQKKQEVSNWWSEERVTVIAAIQLKLLIAGIKMLKPGGELVYSTCTLTPEENELVINTALRKYPVEVIDIEIPIKSNEAFTSYKGEKLHPDLEKARRILPWEVDSEGFFIIKLRKTAPTDPPESAENIQDIYKFISPDHKFIKDHLAELSDLYDIDLSCWKKFKFQNKGNDLFFTTDNWNESNIRNFTRIGTRFGTVGKNDRLQLHSYAVQYLSDKIKANIYNIADINELRNYLGGGIIRTVSSETRITKVIRFKEMVLGTAVPVHNGLKSQFPKSKRMQEIIF